MKMTYSPSYDGHEHARQAKIVLCLAIPVCIGLLVLAPDEVLVAELAAGLALGALCGFWITPDIDHDDWTMEEYRAMRADPLLGRLWVILWRPYSLVFKHRSRWTHSWRGTLLRAVPFMVAIVVGYGLLRHAFSLGVRWLSPFYVGFLAAWLIQDMVHYHHDKLGWLGVE